MSKRLLLALFAALSLFAQGAGIIWLKISLDAQKSVPTAYGWLFFWLYFGGLFVLFFALLYLLFREHLHAYAKREEALNTFFNDAMHELKTPLGVAIFNTGMLEDSKHARRIKAALAQMKICYEDVEFFIKNPSANYPKTKLNISQILSERLEHLETLIELKNIQIDARICRECYVFFNELELVRIIDNNLSNAIKYTKNLIKIRLFKRGGAIYLLIKDNGSGIKEPKKAFERFVRFDLATGGFGIGLNIVKNICAANSVEYKCYNCALGAAFGYKFCEYKKLLLDE